MSARFKILLGGIAAGVALLLAVRGLFVPLDAALRLDGAAFKSAPSMAHPLGADALGRDELSRFLVGARTTVGMALAATLIAFVVGVPLGRWATRSRWGRGAVTAVARLLFIAPAALLSPRWWGRWAMAAGCATLVLPAAVLALAVVVVFGPGMTTSAVTIGLLFAAAPAYAACHVGRTAPAVGSWLSMAVALPIWAMLVATALDYLGLGVQPPLPSWGWMLHDRDWLPWLPTVGLALAVAGGLSLADAAEFANPINSPSDR